MNGPEPGNADVRHCQWYLSSVGGGPTTVTVHLWGTGERATDNWGRKWHVRKCVNCGVVDFEDLMKQYRGES